MSRVASNPWQRIAAISSVAGFITTLALLCVLALPMAALIIVSAVVERDFS